jgi:hypothetical protein
MSVAIDVLLPVILSLISVIGSAVAFIGSRLTRRRASATDPTVYLTKEGAETLQDVSGAHLNLVMEALTAALKDTNSAVFRVGSVVVLKRNDVVTVFELSQPQIVELEKTPEVFRSPDAFAKAIINTSPTTGEASSAQIPSALWTDTPTPPQVE